jgi:hypothetical protein
MIPYTNSRSRAIILTQKEPSANSKPKATNKPKAIYRSKAIIPSTNSKPRAINLTSNSKRIDSKQDLQTTSSLNK